MNGEALPCPFVGLVPYREQDWEFFFGREVETGLIIANLTASRLTLLYGASGVGKSSVIRAGVAHRLGELATRNRKVSGLAELALTVFNTWRDAPMPALARAMRDSAERAIGRDVGPVPETRQLGDACADWAPQVGGEFFVVLDQFEEYFLYHGDEDGESSFAVQFPRLVNREGLRVNFLVSIREDSVARLDRFKGRIPNLFDNYFRLRHLDRSAAEIAIRKPILRFNARHPAEAIDIEDALVDEVLDQTRTEHLRAGPEAPSATAVQVGEATTQIEAPYLQVVMTRLWDEELADGSHRMRLSTFIERLGGADRIVRTHLDREMESLLPAEQDVAAQAFRYLVTRTGSKIALAVDDLAGYTELAPSALGPVLEKLAAGERRILRPVPVPDRPEVVRYEIFHDVLGQAIVAWRRRHDAAREQEAILRNVEERRRAELQVLEQRRAADRSRYLRIGLSVVSIALVGLAIALGFAWQQKLYAEELRAKAQEEANAARFAQQQAELAARDASGQTKAAIEARAANAPVEPPVAEPGFPPKPDGSPETKSRLLREAFVSGDTDTAASVAERLSLLNRQVEFRAQRVPQGYKLAQGQEVYEFTMWPDPASVPGGLRSLSAVTYKMNHPTFTNKLLAGDPINRFKASYYGWGPLSLVPVLLEYADPQRTAQLALFPMAASIEDAGPSAKR